MNDVVPPEATAPAQTQTPAPIPKPEEPKDLVDILDDQGNPIGTKPSKDVDRRNDILHSVQMLILDNEQCIALTRLPERSVWAGRLSTTVATIARHEEVTEVAAVRCLDKELHISHPDMRYLGETFEVLEGNVKRLLSFYVCIWNEPITLDPKDGEIVIMTKNDFLELIQKDRTQFSPPFLTLWDRYSTELPW